MLADIVQGKTGAADLFFLIAVILFAIAFLVRLFYRPTAPSPVAIDGLCIAAGLTSTALALLLL